jgi:hypothetical protein
MKKMMNKRIILTGLSVLLSLTIFSFLVSAYSGSITASPSSGSSITNINCGSTTTAQVNIQNNGGGQALCWYHTDKSATWIKGTSNCVPSGSGTTSFNANIEMPPSGSETRTLYVQCNDYLWPSTCSGTTQYASPSQCYPLSTSCYSSQSATFVYSVSCTPPKFTMVPDKSSVSLTCGGQSTTVSINMQSQDSHTLQCIYRVQNGPIQTIDVPLIAGGTYSFSIPIGFLSPCTTQTISYKVDVACTDSISTLTNTQSTSISVSYTSDPCVAALADARTAISDAQNAVTSAQAKIQEANKIGADVTSAQSSLNQANSQLTTAQSSLSTAQSSCNSGDKTSGVNQANSAKDSANQAKTYATTALNSAQSAITKYEQDRKEAYNKISDANSAIDTAVIMITKTESILNNATQLSSVLPEATRGLDLASEQANINTARVKLDQAKSYVKEAQTALDQKNFDLVKSKAESASKLATDANTLATDSHTRINTVMMTLGEAGKAILSASTEISQTDEILTKMNYVIKNVEKWNIVLTEAKDIVSTGQTNIDAAKDLLSQAKNRLQAGVSTEAVTKAVDARDKAAEPANRLGRIVSSISEKTQDALEKAYSDASSKVDVADAAVKDAANTYMATQSEVTVAQEDLAVARSQLANASSAIGEVKTATDLTSFLGKASLSFSALDDVKDKVNSANAHANAAKMGMYLTVGGTAAVGAGAVGGGFLYWRKKKLKLMVEKKLKMFCETCKKEFSETEKFCSVCGKELKKIVEGKPKKKHKK